MKRSTLTVTLALFMLACGAAHAQGQRVFRCLIEGKVTFQQQACPTHGEGKVLDVKQGNTVAAPQRPSAAPASAPLAEPPQAPPPVRTPALEQEVNACLEHLRPHLRDPRSAYVSAPSRDGRVLSLTVHAANSKGGMGRRKAACEFFNGVLDAGWTKIQLQRLGWFQPRVVQADPRQRHREPRRESLDDIEVPAS